MAEEYTLQTDLPTCKHHQHEELNYYCQTCNLRVCEECLQGRHANHKWMSNKKFARWIRQNAETRCEEIEDMIRRLDIEDVEMEADIGRIEVVRRKWISAINATADEMVKKRRAGRSSKISTKELRRMKKMLKFFQKDINEADDKVAVEMEEEFHKEKQHIRSRNKSSEKNFKFNEGKFSEDIQQMFCDVVEDITLSKVKVTEKSNFTHIGNTVSIYCIVPLPNNEALIKRSIDEHIVHVDVKGKFIKRLPFHVGYFIQMNNDIVFTDFGKKKVRRVTPSGTESDICSTAPLRPDGICKSYNGGLLVTLCSCDIDEITSDSYGEVHHIDTSGGIIKKYSHREDGKSRLFICPRRVAQNKNTDLCVVEYFEKGGRSRLVVVSVSSQIKFTYTGQPDLDEIFICNNVCCDNNGMILLTDSRNCAVHLLSKVGHFLHYVITEQRPQCLGLHGNTLWVGCLNGVVRVYKYNDDE